MLNLIIRLNSFDKARPIVFYKAHTLSHVHLGRPLLKAGGNRDSAMELLTLREELVDTTQLPG